MTSPDVVLELERYLNLITYRKNGNPIRTPVWFANLGGGRLGIFTNENSFKVKRVRRDQRVQVAACNARGKVKGPWMDGHGELVEGDPERVAETFAALKKKYGWQMLLMNVSGRLSGRAKEWKVIEVTFPGA